MQSIEDLFELFRLAANPQQAVKMSAYMRDQLSFLGIPTPQRKQLSRELFGHMDKKSIDWRFVFTCWEQAEREFQYIAMDYLTARKKLLAPSDIQMLCQIAVTKSWWDSIDVIDALVGEIALRYPDVNKTMLEWSINENFWLRRIAIDHQLLRREKTDTALLETIIVNNFGQSEFFINKAIGWSLREYSKTNQEWVRRFIATYRDQMTTLSIREASKYI